jgi:hypothetical protein
MSAFASLPGLLVPPAVNPAKKQQMVAAGVLSSVSIAQAPTHHLSIPLWNASHEAMQPKHIAKPV